MDSVRAAVVQMCTGNDRQANHRAAAELCRQAAELGAELVLLPELWNAWVGRRADLVRAESLEGPTAALAAALARQHRVWIIAGSFLERDPCGALYNTCAVYDPQGVRQATYRKLHLFDVTLDGRDVRRESDLFGAGDRIQDVSTPWGRFGLSICYDLRFPELYRVLAWRDCVGLVVPAAFSAVTGPDHWRALLVARAIENQAFVLAAGQCGRHPDGRTSYGHSLIADPWGRVLCELQDQPGVATAELDFAELRRVRRELPALQHRRIRIGDVVDPLGRS